MKGLEKYAGIMSIYILLILFSTFSCLVFHCEMRVISNLAETFDCEAKIINQRKHCQALIEENFTK